MQVTNLLNAIGISSMNPSSVFLAAGIGTGASNFFASIVNWFIGLIYGVFKWILYLVDIIFSYVQQLAGMNMRWDSLESVFSGDSDMVFNLLWSSRDVVLPIVRALVVIAIVLIIFFSIVAIVKTSFESLRGNGQNQVLTVLKTTFKSFMLMILTPMIALVGIVASNAVLQTLYNATNVSGACSLSSQVFSAASTSANSYRLYANANQRIPIVYDFSREEEILEYYDGKVPTSTFIEHLNDKSNITYATYLMFANGEFLTYDSLNSITGSASAGDVESYYSVYDTSKNLDLENEPLDKFKRIVNYREEYFVMADVVDYCVKSVSPVYFKTIEEVLSSIANLGIDKAQRQRLFDSTVSYFSIEFLDENLNSLPTGYITSENFEEDLDWKAIRWTSNYLTGISLDNPDTRMAIQYTHLRGAEENSEVNGAKYIIAIERTYVDANNVSYSYYYPMTIGETGTYGTVFTSSHIARGQIISAKGIFQDGVYPTAIRQNKAGNVEFFRDKIENSYSGVASQLASFTMENENNKGGFFGTIVGFFRALFDPSSLIPKPNVNLDAITRSYSPNEEMVKDLEGGKLHTSYMFGDVFTTGLLGSNYKLNLSNLFEPIKINYLILVFGAMILFKVSISAVFLLINRALELFLIIIVYPTACATLPLDSGGYDTWVKNYVGRLFATYGIILGLNFVLMLFPVINSIQYFDPVIVGSNIQIRRIGTLFFRAFTVNEVTNMLNFVVSILFELVAFTMISDKNGSGVTKLIDSIVSSESGANPMDNFMGMLAKVGKVFFLPLKAVGTVAKVGATALIPSKRKAFLNKAKDKMVGALPGSAIISSSLDRWGKGGLSEQKKNMKNAKQDLMEALNSGSSDQKEVEKKLKAYQDAQKKYTQALQNPHGTRMSEKEKIKKDKELGVSSRFDYDKNTGGVDVSEMSEKELKKHSRRFRSKTKKRIKKLEKKAKKEGLTEEQQQTLETLQNLRESAAEELRNRKEKESDFAEAERKFRAGEISAEEFAKIKEENDELKNTNKGVGLKKKRKERSKAYKKQKKEAEELRNEEMLFRHTSRGYKKKQNKILKSLGNDIADIRGELGSSGFEGNLETMSSEDISNAVNSDNISDRQRELLQEYQKTLARQRRLLDISKSEYQAQSDNKVTETQRKEAKFAGYEGSNLLKRRKRNRLTDKHTVSDADTERLFQVNQEIKSMEARGIDSSNMKKYRKLLSEKSDLDLTVNSSTVWNENNNAEGQARYKQSRGTLKDRILRKQANNYLTEQGMLHTEENIQRYIDNVMRAKENKKKKKDDE